MSINQRPWLSRVHQQRRARTLDLASRAIARLESENTPVTITTIVVTSREVDPEGHGISHSALLNNADACELYRAHRNWRPRRPVRHPAARTSQAMPRPVKLERDAQAARRRLGYLTKVELIDRLLAAERAYAALYRCSMKLQARALEEEWDALQTRKLPTVSWDKVVDKGAGGAAQQRGRRCRET